MGSLRKISSRYNETYIYKFPQECNYRNAAHWVCRIVNTGIVKTDYVKLRDSERRNDEGNTTIELSSPLDENLMVKELMNRNSNSIVFSGLFKRASISISFDLHKYEIGVAMDKEHLVDEYHIEKEFRLN